MQFHVAALSLAAGLVCGAAILLISALNLSWPSYGHAFLELVASVYPGYHPGAGLGSLVIGHFLRIGRRRRSRSRTCLVVQSVREPFH